MQVTPKSILIIVFIITFLWIDSYACTFRGIPTVKESIESADVIISGKVISVEHLMKLTDLDLFYNRADSLVINEMPMKLVKLIVEYQYEGYIISDTLKIVTPVSEAACGYDFELGEKYIVYGWITDKQQLATDIKRGKSRDLIVSTGLCTRTMRWRQSEHDELISILRK